MTISKGRPLLSGATVALLGLFFALAGGYLAYLGGSWYYLAAGVGMVAAGTLIAAGRWPGLYLYALVWLGTLAWAAWESGPDVWRLMPRVAAPTVLLVYLLMPWVTRNLGGRGRPGPAPSGPGRHAPVATAAIAALLVAGGLVTASRSGAAPGPAVGAAAEADWPSYGRTPGGDRFAPQTQITPANVARLVPAWTSRTGDTADAAERDQNKREFHSEATPLKIGDTLYTCTPHSFVQAIVATTGEVRWTWRLRAERDDNPYLVCRGVAYAEMPAGTPCPRRIFAPTFDARVVALDADTGRECETFADEGYVDLRDNAGPSPPGWQISTSPPVALNGRLVIGSRIIDNEAVDEPAGVVRAYDLVTGAPVWAWDVGRGDDAIPPLPPGETYTRGTPNVWGAITADPALNMVYLPTGNPTPDYYGAQRRPFDERYGTSLVALDATTGRQRWRFQLVHHDLWDFDLAVGPSLVDLPGEGGGPAVPALVQTTKTGQVFLLDRVTGEPVARVEERPVPQDGAAPGERLSPTQPFSTGMPSFTPPPVREADAWGPRRSTSSSAGSTSRARARRASSRRRGSRR